MEKTKLLSELVEFIRSKYLPEEKRKLNKDGGETIFFRKGGKSLCYVETKDGETTVTVVIGISLSDKVKDSNISQKTKKIFDEAKQYYDGKWLKFKLENKNDIDDIKALLLIKKCPMKG